MNIFTLALLNISIFSLYIEWRIGNVWFRTGEDGKQHIKPHLLLKFIVNPLYNRVLWNIKHLDENFIVFSFCNPLNYYLLN